jgi:DNA-binding XRE family transcriptional regulator
VTLRRHAGSVARISGRHQTFPVSLDVERQGYSAWVTLGFVSFGRRLKEYREHRGWSLANLARATHYSRGYLSNLENGRKAPAESVARRCDEVLRANGELIAAAKAATVARLDKAPWQTAELAQRLQMSDTSAGTIETLRSTILELCCQYNYRDALELRHEAQGWLQYVGDLLRRPVGLNAHQELLVAGGWLALLTGCVEYDLGMRAAAESTRAAAQQLGIESGHPEIQGWAHEMSAWFALTQGRYRSVIVEAQRGREIARRSSVHVQLIAQEAKARARLGEAGLQGLLESGRNLLDRLPYPDRPDNHFQVDPAKWDYYAMDVHRLAGDDELTKQYADTVIRDNLSPEGTELSPMRIGESRLALAVVAARAGDLEEAVSLGLTGLKGGRQSRPSLLMVARELDSELQQRFHSEPLVNDFDEALGGI